MDDEREEELITLSSIYPEIVTDLANPYKFYLSIPVAPTAAINLTFKPQADIDSVEATNDGPYPVKHLPPLSLSITLLDGYPEHTFPRVEIDVRPAWLDFVKLKELENECAKLWEEYGRCQILFTYVDHVQQAAERMFDLGTTIHISGKLKDALMQYDKDREQEIFNKSSYDCGICLETKRGSSCHRIEGCGHVFCRPCLQDFFNSAITEGAIANVVCPDPSCGEEKAGAPKRRKNIHPRELIAIGIDEPHARRFVEFKRKKKLEGDKSTIFCPREWCQAAARNNKYPPIPDDLNDYVDPDSDDDGGDAPPAYTKDTSEKELPKAIDRLTLCSNPKCGLAFCRVCYAGWHGEYARCWPRNPAELSAEEQASFDYIRLNTSPCPTCASPTQKTMGCNHMNCSQCNTHFCYLCGAWLAVDNPYQHFNEKGKQCYQRLWELEEGDEGQGGAFQGARMWEAEARAIAEAQDSDLESEAEDSDDEDPDGEHRFIPLAPGPRPAAVRQQNVRVNAAPVVRGIQPPPGPIDPMHAQALQREAAVAAAAAGPPGAANAPAPAAPLVVQLYPENAYPDADNNARRPARRRRNIGGWAAREAQPAPQRERRERPNQQQQQQQQQRGQRQAGRGRGGGADRGQNRGRGDNHNNNGNHPAARDGQPDQRPALADDWAERNNAALRHFVELALQDREDEWDSDELEGVADHLLIEVDEDD